MRLRKCPNFTCCTQLLYCPPRFAPPRRFGSSGSCESLRRPTGGEHQRPDAAGRCPGFLDREFLQEEDRSPPLHGEHLRASAGRVLDSQGGLLLSSVNNGEHLRPAVIGQQEREESCCCHLLHIREADGHRTAMKRRGLPTAVICYDVGIVCVNALRWQCKCL